VERRKTVVGVTLGLLLVSILGMIGPVEKQFFPDSDRRELLVSIFLPQGTAIDNTDRTARRLEKLIEPLPDVEHVSTFVGAGIPRFFASYNPEQPNPAFAKLLVMARTSESRDGIIRNIQRHISAGEFAGARIRLEGLFMGPPVHWPVSFRVVGPDPLELRRIGHRVREIMEANPHTHNAHLEWDERVPVLHLDMDPERLRLMGLTPDDVSRQLQFHLDGIEVTRARADIRSVPVQARSARELGRDLRGVEIRTRDGRKVPLKQLGDVAIEFEDPVVKRYNREPFLAVNSDVRSAQARDVTAALWDRMADLRRSLPPGYRIDIGGTVEESGKADAAIQALLPITAALMLIFTMLQMRSFSGTFMVLATAPLGVVGAVIALLLFQKPFGFVALLGLIGLAGILMRNTLILTQQVSDNLNEGMSHWDAVVEAAVQRARPVILTALAAILAFVPLTLDKFWGPMAYVLIGGVAVGTAITLLFVPALYAFWYRLGENTATSD
jgi:multidrug efflux pump subunit AcrB